VSAVTVIEGDDIRVFEVDGVAVLAPRGLAAAVHEVHLLDVETVRGPQTQLVGDGEVIGTFPARGDAAIPIASEAGEAWICDDQGWYLSVVEHGHWVYVFEADLDSLLALEGTRRCQRHGRSGDVRIEHVEGVWHCMSVEAYRSVWSEPAVE